MEWADILQGVSSIGFSMVIAIWSLKFCFDTMTKNNDKINNQLSELTGAVNNNTIILTKLVEHLEDER